MLELDELRALHAKWKSFAEGPTLAIARNDGIATIYAIDPGVTVDIWSDPLPDGHHVVGRWHEPEERFAELVYEALSDLGAVIEALPKLIQEAERGDREGNPEKGA